MKKIYLILLILFIAVSVYGFNSNYSGNYKMIKETSYMVMLTGMGIGLN